MIILSQDKRMIINFDNIAGIVIRKNTQENVYQIQCKSENEKTKRILGKYKTEERAKEVLQEIIKSIIEGKKSGELSSIFGFQTIPENTYYEMLEE